MLAATVASDPTKPLLTYYDDALGERTELSGATLTNWVSKTANMVVDNGGLVVGDRAAIGLPAHWQSAAVMLGCWTAGLVVIPEPAAADVAFVYVDNATHEWPATERYALNLHPFAMPMRDVPDGYFDFNAEVRAYGDHFYPVEPVLPSADAMIEGGRDWSHSALVMDAAERARQLGISGGRVLIDTDVHPDPRDWLLAPLSAGASIVLCRNTETSRMPGRADSERVTQVVD
jgi:uncharacterized protein (TIGR03089 family)